MYICWPMKQISEVPVFSLCLVLLSTSILGVHLTDFFFLRWLLVCSNHQQVVRTSIIGLGTDEDSLTRAIVTRAEIDMMKVRGEYFNIYKSNLDDAVIGDSSGDYKNFLVTLLGKRIWFILSCIQYEVAIIDSLHCYFNMICNGNNF